MMSHRQSIPARGRTAALSSLAPGLSLVLGLALAACGGDAGAGEAPPPTDSGRVARVINVEVATVSPRSFTERIRLTGTVEANRDVLVPADEEGVVKRVLVEQGTAVRAGQPLVQLDDELLRLQLAQAEAQAEVARETFERNEKLFREDRAISEIQYLEVRARAREAGANRDLLAERLQRTTVRAPFSGVLDERFVEKGERLSLGDPVGRLVELGRVTVTAGVPERYAAEVEVGTPVTVTYDVVPGRTFEGRLSYVGSVVNRDNRTFPVELVLANPDHAIKPEMVATLTLARRTLEEAIVVPQEALVRVEDGFVAYILADEEGEPVARARPVETGAAQDDRVVIQAGLVTGDRLVVVGQKLVADGDRVRVVAEREEVER